MGIDPHKDVYKWSKLNQWLLFGPATAYPIVVPLFFETFQKDKEKWDMELVEKQCKLWQGRVKVVLEKELEDGRKFLMGDEFGAADCCVGYDLMTAEFTGVGGRLIGEGKLKEYVGRLKERESWKKIYIPKEK